MGKVNDNSFEVFKQRLARLLPDADDLKLVGEIARDSIVRTTLAGIGDKDTPFKAYSPAYESLVNAVGGKPGGVVNLRGLFYHKGQKIKRGKTARARGAGRTTKVLVKFKGKATAVTFKSAVTRPQLGLNDPLSEMSADLIAVHAQVANDRSTARVRLIYKPRAANEQYMIVHQQSRRWFSIDKTATKAEIMEAMRIVFKARLQGIV